MSHPLVLVGTNDGFHALGMEGPGLPPGRRMNFVLRHDSAFWAISDHDTVWCHPDDGEGEPVATGAREPLNCLLPTGDAMLVGAGAATLYRLDGVALVRDAGFDAAPGRDSWYTPWGGPPDVRSIAADRSGTIYLNVHVGGVLRSRDGTTWEGTMDVDNDVHQVIADPDHAGRAYAAAAVGLGVTSDGGNTWSFEAEGLVGRYCRAVAVSDTMLFVSGSDGSRGGRAAIYRRPRDYSASLERCLTGLPEWFSGNVDTFCLATKGRLVVAGDPAGSVHVSEDEGETWDEAAAGLPGVHCIGIA